MDDPILSSAAYLLFKAGHYVHLEIEKGLAELDLSPREMLVLSFVDHHAGLSQQELSERLGLDPTIVVGLVDGLEARDLLTRSKDPGDRRRNVLALTTAGAALRKQAVVSFEALQANFLEPLSATDRDRLRRLLAEVLEPRVPWLR
ncbi:MAG: MarR family winged helix-turn-helix transcriptional regulator [Acidimicrobiales bacterium]